LSTTLYGRRFFPYYTFNIVAGLDENGNGITYGYDAVGSYEPALYNAEGSGKELIIPVLDNVILGANKKTPTVPLSVEEMESVVYDAFNAAAERDIHCGDKVEIWIKKKGGKWSKKEYPLRKDWVRLMIMR